MPTCSLSAALPAIAARSRVRGTFSPDGRPRGDGGVAAPTSGFWVNAVQRAGNMRGMFYLGWILVYPNKSYGLFIQPHQQQVPGGGGRSGSGIVSFLIFIVFNLRHLLSVDFIPF